MVKRIDGRDWRAESMITGKVLKDWIDRVSTTYRLSWVDGILSTVLKEVGDEYGVYLGIDGTVYDLTGYDAEEVPMDIGDRVLRTTEARALRHMLTSTSRQSGDPAGSPSWSDVSGLAFVDVIVTLSGAHQCTVPQAAAMLASSLTQYGILEGLDIPLVGPIGVREGTDSHGRARRAVTNALVVLGLVED